uniref:Secreted protein n=1 Tax=Arundo donax TaxID=35708 RepID=A0A0A9CA63_ARUDO
MSVCAYILIFFPAHVFVTKELCQVVSAIARHAVCGPFLEGYFTSFLLDCKSVYIIRW